MRAITKLNTLSDKEIKGLLKFCYSYCIETFGINKRKRTELNMVAAHESDSKRKICGWYCPTNNEITIFIDSCKTVGEFTSTFIHEYTHHMQPCRTKYNKLLKQYGYTKHPFEIEAVSNEKKYNRRLLRALNISHKI